MSQSKLHSLKESITNVAIGFCISLIATFFIFPAVGILSTPAQNVGVTICYTIIAVIRNYVVRRWFNKKSAN